MTVPGERRMIHRADIVRKLYRPAEDGTEPTNSPVEIEIFCDCLEKCKISMENRPKKHLKNTLPEQLVFNTCNIRV